MRAVNLLPRDSGQERRRPQAPALIGVVGTVLVTGMVCSAFLMKSSEVQQQQRALDLAERELAAIPPPAPVEQAAPQLQQVRDTRLTAVSSALSRRVTWDRVLRRFSQVLPDDVWLTTLSVSSPLSATVAATPGAPGGGGFLLNGFSYSHDSVARLLARLGVVPDLANVQLQRSSVSKVEGRDVVTFSIQATIRGVGPSA